MNALVLVCGNVFDGISETLTGPAEILVEDHRIAQIERSVEQGEVPCGAPRVGPFAILRSGRDNPTRVGPDQ
jgi:hypothetical protein